MDTKFRNGLIWLYMDNNTPSALIHISTGVVYASPGVVKIPPCVLN